VTGSGRERARHLDWQLGAAVLAIVLLLTMVPAAWTHPAGIARAQDEVAAGDIAVPRQVIAQGIARLSRGDVAWTVRTMEVPGDEGTPVASFPIGFAVANGAAIAVLDADGDVLNLLADGEAAFLPNGKAGALASWQDDVASLYEVALVSGREASAGETPDTVAGTPFAAPEGDAFDVEIARTVLTRDDQTTIPASRSGTPSLYLQTSGTTQLQAGGAQTVELTTGQFALLVGDVMVRGASDEPATFLVAAIGEATVERDATAGTPEARANREDRQQARAQSDDAPRAARTRQKRAKRVRTGGGAGGAVQGGQTAPAGAGGTGTAPISGGVDATTPAEAPAGTPPMEPTVEATLPGDTRAPGDGTPPPEATLPTQDEAPAEPTVTPDPAAPAEEIFPTEEPSGEPPPTVEAPPDEEIVPGDETPAEEPPIVEEPVVEPTAGA
jgi:hypothetical protein